MSKNYKDLTEFLLVHRATDKTKITTTLSNVLGSFSVLRGNELAFYCPFCHHHKQKLQINMRTQKWHCWVSNVGGRSLFQLLNNIL